MLVTAWLTHLARGPTATIWCPSEQAAALLVGTLIPALGLIVLWGRRIAIRRAGGTTARLHVNLVFFFSLIAAIPTLFVAVFASRAVPVGRGVLVLRQFARDHGKCQRTGARAITTKTSGRWARSAVAMAGDIRFMLETVPITSQVFQEQFAATGLYARTERKRHLSQARKMARCPTRRHCRSREDDRERVRISPETLEIIRHRRSRGCARTTRRTRVEAD